MQQYEGDVRSGMASYEPRASASGCTGGTTNGSVENSGESPVFSWPSMSRRAFPGPKGHLGLLTRAARNLLPGALLGVLDQRIHVRLLLDRQVRPVGFLGGRALQALLCAAQVVIHGRDEMISRQLVEEHLRGFAAAPQTAVQLGVRFGERAGRQA